MNYVNDNSIYCIYPFGAHCILLTRYVYVQVFYMIVSANSDNLPAHHWTIGHRNGGCLFTYSNMR